MPELSPEEKVQLQDHVALARLIVTQRSQPNNKAFKPRRADFDRSFGDGLRFLHERAGADLAILLDGVQVKQSGGSTFMQLALAAAGVGIAGGGGTQVVASVLDFARGDVEWFNSTLGVEVFGMGGKDVRDSNSRRARWKPRSRNPADCTAIPRWMPTCSRSWTGCSRTRRGRSACAPAAIPSSTRSRSRPATYT